MPVKIGRKKYKTFGRASAALQKSKGYSKRHANAVVGKIEANKRKGKKKR